MVTRYIFGLGDLKFHTFMLAKGQEILTDDALPLSLETSDFKEGPGGKSYPEKLDWEWRSEEGQVTLSLRKSEMIESLDMLEGTSWWWRPLIQLIANPFYYDFNADMELTVDLKGVKATERGRAARSSPALRSSVDRRWPRPHARRPAHEGAAGMRVGGDGGSRDSAWQRG